MTPTELKAAFDALAAQAAKNESVEASAALVMSGFQARVDAAVAKVLADNPSISADQLKGITDETAALGAASDALSAAIATVPTT